MPTPLLDNRQLGPEVGQGRNNLLVNGGFEVWQRGNGPFGAGAYNADRWTANIGTGASFSASIARDQSANVDINSNSCWTCTNYVGGSTPSVLDQAVEIGNRLRGSVVTFSVRVRTNVANHIRVALIDVDGTTIAYSNYHTGGNTYETLAVSLTCAANNPSGNLTCRVVFTVSSAVNLLDNAMLVVGSQRVDYVQMPMADELARCLRYYERLGDAFGDTVGTGTWTGNTTGWFTVRFKVKKVVQPTFTYTPAGLQIFDAAGATWHVSTSISTAFGGIESALISFNVAAGTAAAGHAAVVTGAASGSGIVLEANP